MRIRIDSPKVRSVVLGDKFFDTNQFIDVDFSTAVRLSRKANVIMENPVEKYDPRLFNEENKFVFLSEIDMFSGWGNVGINLIKSSTPPFSIAQFGQLHNVTETTTLRASRAEIDPKMAVIIHEQPKGEWEKLPFERKICIVPFETTKIPPSWIPRINKCKALLVPCRQNMEAFRDSGVTIPIELIHWGVDPVLFKPLVRETGRPFTFGTMGALSTRKGTDLLLEAFLRAFPTEKDVRLLCKTSNFHFMGAVKDKRVRVDMTPVSHQELMDNFFKQVDCFVFPTRGEGFGLTPLEAMATGIPAIVTGWSGPAEYMTPEIGWTINHKMVPAKEFTEITYKEDCGDWAEPDIDHLVQLMRYAYEHQDEVRQKGKNAGEYIRQKWLWQDKIKMYHEALKKHLNE